MNNSVQTNNHCRGVRDQVVSPPSLLTCGSDDTIPWSLLHMRLGGDTTHGRHWSLYVHHQDTLQEGGRWKMEGGSPLQTVGQAVAAG